MKTQSFDYFLPKKLIAQKPTHPRDHSKLMVISRQTKTIKTNRHFFDLAKILKENDVLVLNNSKVFPARLVGKKPTGGRIEIFLLHQIRGNLWQCLIGGKKKQKKLKITLAGLKGVLIKQVDKSVWQIKFNKNPLPVADRYGLVPTPPYIKQIKNQTNLKKQYQTVYAKTTGSVAAPTAGLHFTNQLINKLKKKGIKFEYITLHVGLGTFGPVKENNLGKVKLHAEFATLNREGAKRLNQYKKQGKRIIAVGTTTCRTLEAFANKKDFLKAQTKWVDLFIYPPYKFKFTDALITNLHLPKSSLLMLVSAFASKKLINTAYQKAIKNKWRFYSFGDAMLIE